MNRGVIQAVMEITPELRKIIDEAGVKQPSEAEIVVLLLAQLVRMNRETISRLDRVERKLDAFDGKHEV